MRSGCFTLIDFLMSVTVSVLWNLLAVSCVGLQRVMWHFLTIFTDFFNSENKAPTITLIKIPFIAQHIPPKYICIWPSGE